MKNRLLVCYVRMKLNNVAYRRNLQLVTELGDRAAQGRVFGNLGNTFYLLGNFEQAISHHQQVPVCTYVCL